MRRIAHIMVEEMGYTWQELRDELLADVLYSYAMWEKKQKKKKEEMDKNKV